MTGAGSVGEASHKIRFCQSIFKAGQIGIAAALQLPSVLGEQRIIAGHHLHPRRAGSLAGHRRVIEKEDIRRNRVHLFRHPQKALWLALFDVELPDEENVPKIG